ncbi:hypothetical protein GGQ85_002966 [Nitrobacter vulgaris]|nr:hypothetical protein [Nitrobacter vulgaris]
MTVVEGVVYSLIQDHGAANLLNQKHYSVFGNYDTGALVHQVPLLEWLEEKRWVRLVSS